MTKAAHLLTSFIFALICATLWAGWWMGERYLESAVGEGVVSATMGYALLAYPWVFAILPVPAIIYSAVLMDRTELLPEKALLYFVLMVLVSLILIGVSGALFGVEWSQITHSIGNA